jgi:NDP-sugar pyrophosphorylase family protein
MDVVVLCGGLGKRIRSITNDRPKPMLEIDNQPFLDILINYVSGSGFRRFILCLGYLGNFIKQHYQDKRNNLEILFSEEKEFLGTGGAIKNAEALIETSPFLVLNGDSFCQVDLRKFIKFHRSKEALVSIAVAKVENGYDYGVITLNGSQRIYKFSEKFKSNKNNFINAGVYLFQKESLLLMPANKKFSLERDFFPKLVDKEFYGYIIQGTFIDIGTPERYKNAKKLLKYR